jgi:hypothetical protein
MARLEGGHTSAIMPVPTLSPGLAEKPARSWQTARRTMFLDKAAPRMIRAEQARLKL